MNNIEQQIDELTREVITFIPDPNSPHDKYIIITLIEALKAVKEDNFGVGAVLIHEDGEIIERGHNRVFKPYFRSDQHAEMHVMTKFENRYKDITQIEKFILFSSMEPCPMCFARLLISGIKRVYYATSNETGGMVHKLKDMTSTCELYAQGKNFSLAKCSPRLQEMSMKIFMVNAKEKYENILYR